jgi:hypothetical protein
MYLLSGVADPREMGLDQFIMDDEICPRSRKRTR